MFQSFKISQFPTKSKSPPCRKLRDKGGAPVWLVDFEMEDIGDLEVGAIVENQISTDHHVHIVRGRRWKHDLQLARARLHLPLKPRRQSSIHDQLALESRRQTVPLGQPWRQMLVVSAVPVVDVAIMVGIVLVAAMFVIMSVTVLVVAIVIVVPIMRTLVIIAVVFVVTVVVVLRESNRGRERQRD